MEFRLQAARYKMHTKHKSSNSPVADGILSDQALRRSEVDVCRGDSVTKARTTCNKFKQGYNGAAKVDSESHNQHGDVNMNDTTETNYEAMQARIESTEKVVSAGLAGHKAELAGQKSEFEGYKSNIDGKFAAMSARVDADRAVSDAKFQAHLERMDADRAVVEANREASEAKFQATQERMDAKFQATQERMDAKFQATQERMDAERKISEANRATSDAKFQAMEKRLDDSQRRLEDKIEASATGVKLWVIITVISVAATVVGALKAFGGI